MKQIFKKTYQGYILYGFLLTICLLYFCFPSDAFRDYFIKAVSSTNPQVMVSIEEVRPSLLLGVILLNSRFSLKTNPKEPLFSLKKIAIRKGIWPLLTGKSKYNFNIRVRDGEVEGFFQTKENKNVNFVNTSFEFQNISIDDFSYLSNLIGLNTRGTANGKVTLEGQTDTLLRGTGNARLKITKGTVALEDPLFNLETINFEELLIKLALKDNKIELTHFKINGKELQGTLTGVIRLNHDFMNSRLDLEGTVKLLSASFFNRENGSDTDEFRQDPLELPFKVRGTIEKPEYNFS